MGKKSNAKKALRKIKEAEHSKKHKVKKEKKEAPKKRKFPCIGKRKLLAFILAIVLAVSLLAFGYFLFQKAFRAAPIAKLLPVKETVAFIEVLGDPDNSQFTKANKLLANHPNFSQKSITDKLEENYAINYERDLKPWLGRQIGVALIITDAELQKTSKIYFAEVKNHTELDQLLLKDATQETHENSKIYTLPHPLYITKIRDYVFISREIEPLQTILHEQDKAAKKLYYSQEYRKINEEMPLNRFANIYLDFEKIDPIMLQNLEFLTADPKTYELATSIFTLLEAEGISVRALDEHFAIETFTSLDRRRTEDIHITFNAKYDATLANYVASDALAFWGGENLENRMKRTVEMITGGDKGKIAILNTMIINYSDKYFGSEISFEEEILPLFQNEFAIALEEYEEGVFYKMLIELTHPRQDAMTLQELANGFAETAAIFEPKVVSHTLEDGTVTKEIVAVPEEIRKTEQKYEGTTIYQLEMGQKNWGIYYAIVDDIAVLATHPSGVKTTIDNIKKGDRGLRSSEIFAKEISPILLSSDEISYFNIERLGPILAEQFNREIPGWITPIASFTSGKNYSHDGITGVSYLTLDSG